MKFEKQVSLKWAIALVLIACLVSSSIVYYVFAVSPSSTFTISGGIYPGAPSYTIWREGSNYFAKDANGEIDYSGTNASQVIQSTLDKADSEKTLWKGTTVLVKSMEAVLTNTITVYPSVSLYFEEKGCFNITHSGIAFYGHGGPSPVSYTFNLYLDACFILKENNTIFLNLVNPIFSKITIATITADSYRANTTGILFTNDDVNVGPYYNNIRINHAQNIETAVKFPHTGYSGANANNVEYLCANTVKYGVWIGANVSDIRVQLLMVHGGGIKSDGAAIYIDGFSNHIVSLYGEYSVGAWGGVLLYLDVHAVNNYAPCIVQEGSAGWVTNNSSLKNDIGGRVGYVTENSGTATITASTTVTFNHGLAGTPTHVECGFKTLGYGSWSWSATSTQITITVATSGSYTFSWHAEYNP